MVKRGEGCLSMWRCYVLVTKKGSMAGREKVVVTRAREMVCQRTPISKSDTRRTNTTAKDEVQCRAI